MEGNVRPADNETYFFHFSFLVSCRGTVVPLKGLNAMLPRKPCNTQVCPGRACGQFGRWQQGSSCGSEPVKGRPTPPKISAINFSRHPGPNVCMQRVWPIARCDHQVDVSAMVVALPRFASGKKRTCSSEPHQRGPCSRQGLIQHFLLMWSSRPFCKLLDRFATHHCSQRHGQRAFGMESPAVCQNVCAFQKRTGTTPPPAFAPQAFPASPRLPPPPTRLLHFEGITQPPTRPQTPIPHPSLAAAAAAAAVIAAAHPPGGTQAQGCPPGGAGGGDRAGQGTSP